MKACLFDIDGTLVLTGGAGQVAFAETFAEEFGVQEITNAISFAGRSDRAIAMDLFRAHDVPATTASWDLFQSGYLQRLEEALARCVGQVLPGVDQLLDRLEARGDVLVGLLTGNVREAAASKLGYYGLWQRFEGESGVFGGFGDEHTDRNDIAATAVGQARERHAAKDGAGAGDKEVIVVIGDTPNDIRCGRSIGAKVVAVPTGHTPSSELATHEPDLLVDTLEDADTLVSWFDD
ncbi:MAG: haloacid dehalogenase-like hydrolase [Planctomycetota bacterium]